MGAYITVIEQKWRHLYLNNDPNSSKIFYVNVGSLLKFIYQMFVYQICYFLFQGIWSDIFHNIKQLIFYWFSRSFSYFKLAKACSVVFISRNLTLELLNISQDLPFLNYFFPVWRSIISEKDCFYPNNHILEISPS